MNPKRVAVVWAEAAWWAAGVAGVGYFAVDGADRAFIALILLVTSATTIEHSFGSLSRGVRASPVVWAIRALVAAAVAVLVLVGWLAGVVATAAALGAIVVIDRQQAHDGATLATVYNR